MQLAQAIVEVQDPWEDKDIKWVLMYSMRPLDLHAQ